MPVTLDTSTPGFEAQFTGFLNAKREAEVDVDAAVAGIIADVRARGDAALIGLTAKFDKLDLTPETLVFSGREIADAAASVNAPERAALELAANRIRAYHGNCRRMKAGRTRQVSFLAGAGRRSPAPGFMFRVVLPAIRRRC